MIANRLVALGASNLTLMLPTLLDLAIGDGRAPVEVFAALGYGRSYVGSTTILGRTLPGIGDCGIWDALAATPRAPTTGIVMDVGIDVLYGHPFERILADVDRAIARLRGQVDRLVVTGLPIPGVRDIDRVRYGFVCHFLVPGCPVSRQDAVAGALRLHDALRERAAAHDAEFLELEERWYGFDPIHVRVWHWTRVCRLLLGLEAPVRSSVWGRAAINARVRTARPQWRRLFGREQRADQPVRRLRGGSTLSMY